MSLMSSTTSWRSTPCAYSSPAPAAGSAPPSSRSSRRGPRGRRASPAPTRRPRRSPRPAPRCTAASLDDLDGPALRRRGSDGVIHLAFKHDVAFSGGFEAAADADRRAIETFGDALARHRPAARHRLRLAGPRARRDRDRGGRARPGRRPRGQTRLTERAALALAALGRALVERAARADRPRRRRQRLHRHDRRHRAREGRLGLRRRRRQPLARGAPAATPRASSGWRSRARPAGSVLHAAAEEGVPTRGIAEAIGRRPRPAGGVGRSATPRALRLAGRASSAMDVPASSARTRELLGWEPTQPGLLEDLEQGHYTREPVT